MPQPGYRALSSDDLDLAVERLDESLDAMLFGEAVQSLTDAMTMKQRIDFGCLIRAACVQQVQRAYSEASL